MKCLLLMLLITSGCLTDPKFSNLSQMVDYECKFFLSDRDISWLLSNGKSYKEVSTLIFDCNDHLKNPKYKRGQRLKIRGNRYCTFQVRAATFNKRERAYFGAENCNGLTNDSIFYSERELAP